VAVVGFEVVADAVVVFVIVSFVAVAVAVVVVVAVVVNDQQVTSNLVCPLHSSTGYLSKVLVRISQQGLLVVCSDFYCNHVYRVFYAAVVAVVEVVELVFIKMERYHHFLIHHLKRNTLIK
jgi:hypothetical protein